MIYFTVTMAAAWHGGVESADQYAKSVTVLDAISRAMDYWFANDFTDAACLASGGGGGCPCGTPGLWNTNWFSNVSARDTPQSYRTILHL